MLVTTRIWWHFNARQNQDAWDHGDRFCGLRDYEMVGTAMFPALGMLCDEVTMDYADDHISDPHGLRANYPPLW